MHSWSLGDVICRVAERSLVLILIGYKHSNMMLEVPVLRGTTLCVTSPPDSSCCYLVVFWVAVQLDRRSTRQQLMLSS